jgi:hypothetical protein
MIWDAREPWGNPDRTAPYNDRVPGSGVAEAEQAAREARSP